MANNNGDAVDSIRNTNKNIWIHTGIPRIHSGLLKERQTLERFKKEGSSVTSIIFASSAVLLFVYLILKFLPSGVDK